VRPGELRRGKGLCRGRGPTRKSGLRVRPLPPEVAIAREAIRLAVFTRDGHCRLRDTAAGPCFGRLTVHHLWKDGQGGDYSELNLITLCAHHNDWVEGHRSEADTWGLRVGYGEDVPSAWRRLIFAELVDYWWDGTSCYADQPELDAA
jgi:hypothetical protein